MIKRTLQLIFAMSLLGALLYGCSDSSTNAPLVGTAHPDGWVLTHKADYRSDPASCTGCHGGNYEGSGAAPACNSCHLGSAPDFTVHPAGWTAPGFDTFNMHRHFHNDDKLSWTTCATAECHGATLHGGHGSGPTGPSCFSTTFTNENAITNGCHPTGPPAPQSHTGGNFSDPANHGPEAKGANQNNNNQLVCRNCHGRPTHTFDGGFVADPNILNNGNGTCSQLACHPAAQAHPTEWQGSVDDIDPNYFSSHRTTDQTTRDAACALCHKVTSGGPGPKPGAPSCFSSNFTNANGTANNCHPNGPGVAPHPTDGTYTNPDSHGPDAKANLAFCAGCHATDSAPGSNPRFNVQIGGLLNGCETCHKAGTAHPDSDRWTFNLDGNTRRTHFASGNISTACAMCHNVNVGDTAGQAPACTGCHLTQGVFTSLDCTTCHGTPPDGTVDLTGAPTPVDHAATKAGAGNFADVSAVAQHEVCSTCHGAKDDGNGRLTVKNSNYQLFDANDPALNQGGDHLDGQLEMNGPAPSTGAGYDSSTVGCAQACHGNDTAHQLPNNADASGNTLPLVYGDYGGGSGCTSCHQYPPDANSILGAPTIVPVSHLFNDNGVTLLANHDDCAVCHGTKDDGSGSHAPATNYNPSTDHQNGSINLNVNYGYNRATGGCAQSCHGDNSTHQFPVAGGTGNSIIEVDYGQSVAGCNACHGYPPDGTADSTTAVPVSHLFNDSGSALLANHNECQLCHGTKDDGTGAHLPTGDYNVSNDHSSGNININSQLQYVSNPADPNFGGCNNSCHGNTAGHRFPNSSGLQPTLGDYGGFTCASCHDGGANGAPIVKIGDSHTQGSGISKCEDCHPGGTRGTLHGDGGQAQVVFIPNNPTVGINYSSHGGIYLGGDATSQTSEAEICWGCHDNFIPKISEWGVNSTVNTGLQNYDYGQIYADAGTTTVTSNWVGAYWKSATPDFAYKTGQVSSTHSVNSAVTGPGVDTVDQIRCSYCHDVHDRNQAPGDTVSGAPFLRGTWKGNPYPEDGAPQSGHNYASNNRYGQVPRGSTSSNETGGYQIDQNNGNPNIWTADQFGGLCELCHGSGDGSWTSNEIDNINQFGNDFDAWVGTNGHSAAVKGGGGSNAADILTAAIRNPSGIGSNRNDSGRPDMGYYSYQGDRGYGFRSLHGYGWLLSPSLSGSSENKAFDDYSWKDLGGGFINTNTGLDTNVHEFTCSKCHNPHASRLPRLMITNCLDTKHNTWDDDFQTIPNTSNGDGASTPSSENIGVRWSNSTSAQNCHRVKDPSFNKTSVGAGGWNNVTPWGAGGGTAPDNGNIQ